MINDRPVDGVVDSVVDLTEFNMHFYTPEKAGKIVLNILN